jgi:hypothetical protein
MCHVTILFAIKVYHLFVMCQGIMNNSVYTPERNVKLLDYGAKNC